MKKRFFGSEGRLITRNKLDDVKRVVLIVKMVSWIVDSKQSLSLVIRHDEDFQGLVKGESPCFKVPSERKFTRGVEDPYNSTRGKMKLVIDGIPGDVAKTRKEGS